MTKEEIKADFIKNGKSNKFHFNKKKYLESLWENDRMLRVGVYKKLFILDMINRDEYEQFMIAEDYGM